MTTARRFLRAIASGVILTLLVLSACAGRSFVGYFKPEANRASASSQWCRRSDRCRRHSATDELQGESMEPMAAKVKLSERRHFIKDWSVVLAALKRGQPVSVVVLCGVNRGGNLGAVLRTAAMLGVPLVVALGGIDDDTLDAALWTSQLLRRPSWRVMTWT
eukprot:TRINITY_DN29407_c1_g1_i1.p1 TRINITY_DN29407_c1_g1~~TRINITY_DN29407_c1_g1_i1.p1  ORF type:complete len:162 (+),score=11.59 TRINITY_DN29407_c1_g1_i1:103-588(+)